MTGQITVGEEDGDRWLQVQRYPGELVFIRYLEGPVTMSSLELPDQLAAELGAALCRARTVGVEHRAVFPAQILADALWEERAGSQAQCEAVVQYVNRQLAAAGLPESAHVEARELLATPWARPADEPRT